MFKNEKAIPCNQKIVYNWITHLIEFWCNLIMCTAPRRCLNSWIPCSFHFHLYFELHFVHFIDGFFTSVMGDLCTIIKGQNRYLPISPKTSNKMPLFWNYLAISLFWNSIFKKSCFNEKLDLMKIELLAKCYMKLEFHGFFIFFFYFFYFLSFWPITQFSKNRVFYWNSIN